MSKRNRTKGFSLVELLLVVAIIAIIGGIAVPAFMGQRQRAKDIGDAKTNARVIQMALESRKAEMGVYGKPGDYTYKSDGTDRPASAEDIIPTFTPKGNSKMDYTITIGPTGLTYEISVVDPTRKDMDPIKFNQNGEVVKST